MSLGRTKATRSPWSGARSCHGISPSRGIAIAGQGAGQFADAFVVADQQEGADVLRHGPQPHQQFALRGEVEASLQGDRRGGVGQPVEQRCQRLAGPYGR